MFGAVSFPKNSEPPRQLTSSYLAPKPLLILPYPTVSPYESTLKSPLHKSRGKPQERFSFGADYISPFLFDSITCGWEIRNVFIRVVGGFGLAQ